MKKTSLILLLALVLVCAFATIALADLPPSDRSGYVALNDSGTAINIHSGYTVNSDACASCHSAHQAYNDPNLADGSKQKKEFLLYDESATCMACHDGTVTKTYDVKAGHIADATDANGNPVLTKGGLFAVQNAGSAAEATAISASEHPAFPDVYNRNMTNIPGGKQVQNPVSGTDYSDTHGAWSASDVMSCSSCHEAHGAGGNPRLLNPNPNLVMSQGTSGAGVQSAQLVDFSVTAYDPNTKYSFSNITIIPGTTKDARGTFYDASTTRGMSKLP